MALDHKDGQERTLGQLVAQATQDISVIVRKEIELAKAEVTGSLRFAAKAVPLLVLAGVLALYGLGLLLTAGAWGLTALGLPSWAGFLIVAGVLFVIAAILALVGRRALARVRPVPQRAIAGLEETVTALKDARAAGTAHARIVPAPGSQQPLGERPRAR